MKIFLIVVLGLLGGCSYVNEFNPTSETTFTFWAGATSDNSLAAGIMSKDSPEIERDRLQKITHFISLHNMCSSGYHINSRKEVLMPSSSKIQDHYRIYYTGECTGPAPEPETSPTKEGQTDY